MLMLALLTALDNSHLLLWWGGLWLLACSAWWCFQYRRRRFALIAVMLVAVFSPITVVETAAALFWYPSDGWAGTLAGRRWFSRYWNPINSLGFRDQFEPANALPVTGNRRPLILCAGDSFTAGHGIAQINDRFADRLQEQLETQAQVAMAAQCGWNTRDQIAAIKSYPLQPTFVIVSFVPNDFEAIADVPWPARLNQHPSWAPWLPMVLDRSVIGSALYWDLVRRSGQTPALDQRKNQFLEVPRSVANWQRFVALLEELRETTRARNAELLLVAFPFLDRLEKSADVTQAVVRECHRRGIDAIDLTPWLTELPRDRLVASPWDAHPSAAVHHLVGNRLAELVGSRLDTLYDLNIDRTASRERNATGR